MEFLLLIILVLLIVILVNSKSRKKNIRESLEDLHNKINELKKNLDSKSFENKPTSVEKPIVPKEIDIVKPIVVEKPLSEVIQPVADKPISEKPIEVVAKIEAKPIVEKPVTPKPVYVPKKSWFETFKENNPDLEKFIGENLINKIGILILVLGISFFVKFAIDKDWITKPARVGIGILCGSLIMFFAHKLKKNYAAFSSVLVAGAISIFYFTIAIAFHEYELFSQNIAFGIMTVITLFSVLVSISYNRQELAVLSLIGGFAVPLMLSTGQGNYIVLFSYLAILNSGILIISYFKKWKLASLLSFLFTWLFYFAWYSRELFADNLPHLGALIFASIFFFIFSILIVMNNLRNKGQFSYVEYMAIIVNSFVFFGFGMGIIYNWGITFKGVFTLILAAYNLIYALLLFKKFKLEKNVVYVLIGLTLTFTTLTIPIQFSGNQITVFWAIESVLLLWLAQKSKINTFKIGYFIVFGLSLISLLLDWVNNYASLKTMTPEYIINGVFVTGLVVIASLIANRILLKKEAVKEQFFTFEIDYVAVRNVLLILALAITYIVGYLEINFHAKQNLINFSSITTYGVAYHFVFSAVLLFFIIKKKKATWLPFALLLILLNFVLYIVSFYGLTAQEQIDNYVNNTNANAAFYLHYIVLLCLGYFGYLIYHNYDNEAIPPIFKSKVMLWLFAFTLIYVLSNEVMLHSLYFSDITTLAEVNKQFPLDNMIDSPYDSTDYLREQFVENKFDNIKRQIIKIGYPVLWGIFAFMFLIIGIKKSWKQLRIIALTLLGITIVKLFAYDINNVSETGKIIAFILLGVLILIISFVYQKIKKLVVDEQPKPSSDEEIQ